MLRMCCSRTGCHIRVYLYNQKYDAVTYYEPIASKLSSKKLRNSIQNKLIEPNSSTGNGVLFFNESAYLIETSSIGRIFIEDKLPIEDAIFWSYKCCDDEFKILKGKFLLNVLGKTVTDNFLDSDRNIFKTCDSTIDKHYDNFLFIDLIEFKKKIEPINLIKDIHKTTVSISLCDNLEVTVYFCGNKKFNFSLPYFLKPNKTHISINKGSESVVNGLVLNEIINKGFREHDFIKIKFNSNNSPMVLCSCSKNKPRIHWAISV